MSGTKSKSEWSVERQDVEGSKGSVEVFYISFRPLIFNRDKTQNEQSFLVLTHLFEIYYKNDMIG